MASYDDLNFEWSMLCRECAAWTQSGTFKTYFKFILTEPIYNVTQWRLDYNCILKGKKNRGELLRDRIERHKLHYKP